MNRFARHIAIAAAALGIAGNEACIEDGHQGQGAEKHEALAAHAIQAQSEATYAATQAEIKMSDTLISFPRIINDRRSLEVTLEQQENPPLFKTDIAQWPITAVRGIDRAKLQKLATTLEGLNQSITPALRSALKFNHEISVQTSATEFLSINDNNTGDISISIDSYTIHFKNGMPVFLADLMEHPEQFDLDATLESRERTITRVTAEVEKMHQQSVFLTVRNTPDVAQQFGAKLRGSGSGIGTSRQVISTVPAGAVVHGAYIDPIDRYVYIQYLIGAQSTDMNNPVWKTQIHEGMILVGLLEDIKPENIQTEFTPFEAALKESDEIRENEGLNLRDLKNQDTVIGKIPLNTVFTVIDQFIKNGEIWFVVKFQNPTTNQSTTGVILGNRKGKTYIRRLEE